MGHRHILAPEIPRSRHVGGGGVHISGAEQARFFNRRSFNDNVTYARIDVER